MGTVTVSKQTLRHNIVQSELGTFYNPLNAGAKASISNLSLKTGTIKSYSPKTLMIHCVLVFKHIKYTKNIL